MAKKRKSKRKRKRRRELSWEEAIEEAFKLCKPVLDKLREYDLKEGSSEEWGIDLKRVAKDSTRSL